MEIEEFELLIQEAIASIPKRFRDRMDNVAFVVESTQRPPVVGEQPIRHGGRLLGLYQGVPYRHRGPYYTGALPDKITLFHETIESYAGHDQERIRDVVHSTVAHEVAHYFGMDEREVRNWERQRKSK